MTTPARVWLDAARPRTLPAALAPIAVGTALAFHEGAWHPGIALLALATALLLQVAANLANDVFDFERGADGEDRLGPARATQRGLVAPGAMRRAALFVALAAALAGVFLVWRGGWPIALAGAASLAAAILYTGGPWPLGYHGLGDLLVFVFFGCVGVVGSHYLQTLAFSPAALWAAVPVGMLATSILVVNNLRDRTSDARAGKRTLAVRMGPGPTRVYFAILVLGAPCVVIAAVLRAVLPPGALLSLALLPALLPLARAFWRRDGAALNPLLGASAQACSLFSLALALGLLA